MTKLVYPDDLTASFYWLAGKYNIKLEWWQEGALTHTQRVKKKFPDDFSWGPQEDCGFSFKERYVYGYGCGSEYLFHEIVHLIVGPPSLKLCEGFVLMPFELELAKFLSKRMRTDAHSFIEDVKQYQECTTITQGPNKDYGELWPEQRRHRWWKRSVERARKLGLLDEKNEPTFRDAVWDGTGLKTLGRRWHVKMRET